MDGSKWSILAKRGRKSQLLENDSLYYLLEREMHHGWEMKVFLSLSIYLLITCKFG